MVSQKPKYCKNFERNSHWRKLFMIIVWERYCNASPKPEFFSFSLFIFSFISQLIWVRLGWNFHRWFSLQKQVNWCTIDPFSLRFCTSQHSYPVPLIGLRVALSKLTTVCLQILRAIHTLLLIHMHWQWCTLYFVPLIIENIAYFNIIRYNIVFWKEWYQDQWNWLSSSDSMVISQNMANVTFSSFSWHFRQG